ncbi:MAG: DUF3866 family protein [Acidimicrobiales bacterium]|nr:DUF3866 family protein [Acidimicrobiales bacterium]
MPSFAEGVVAAVLGERSGIVRVRLENGDRAYSVTQTTGPVEVGDRVVVNTTAVDLALGTGGWHIVHWNLTRGPWKVPGPGHLMKLRYTSVQVDTGAAEEHDPDIPSDLGGTPVVVAGLHSQLPVVAVALDAALPGVRIAYVMTDGGALPLALSDTVAELGEKGLLVGTVTAGHAFGGDHECLNVPSALAVARHRLDADVIIVAMGPGVAGTGSRLGYTALEVAPILDAVDWLGGWPIACARASSGDARSRHQGLSHHTITALEAVRSKVTIALPPALEPPTHLGRHDWVQVEPGPIGDEMAARGLTVKTMGRGFDEDRLFFETTAVAGRLAAERGGTSRRGV